MKLKSFLSTFVALAITSLTFISCEKAKETEVSLDTLPGKVIVHGFVRYQALDDKGKPTDLDKVPSGTIVKINYKVTDADYNQMEVQTNNKGYFKIELGCTPNGSADIVVSSSLKKESTYAVNEEGKLESTSAHFYGQEKANIADGSAHTFNLILTQVAPFDGPGLE